ncbi:hypothetical protein GGU11DRAFT_844847 [Lentinula aff. detonsa]|uniref:Uncharacterized protein n=1 Tax=Lentinula aff. detonsa TaxID=2804958 RepID=A0AA38NHY7_9AGAR|nr:hypothetical protein GGU10DRAFT_408705 [Lentinula aff. detonsa]KAJ3794400.1 hypothetical protein GGU11DRAFT_844847 [Lentinula aff. detonsa]
MYPQFSKILAAGIMFALVLPANASPLHIPISKSAPVADTRSDIERTRNQTIHDLSPPTSASDIAFDIMHVKPQFPNDLYAHIPPHSTRLHKEVSDTNHVIAHSVQVLHASTPLPSNLESIEQPSPPSPLTSTDHHILDYNDESYDSLYRLVGSQDMLAKSEAAGHHQETLNI